MILIFDKSVRDYFRRFFNAFHGKQFRLQIGRLIKTALNRREYLYHVFADLEHSVCAGCEIFDFRTRKILFFEDKLNQRFKSGYGLINLCPIFFVIDILGKYIAENDLSSAGKLDYPLFSNHQHTKLTRAGVAYLLKKYCDAARKENPLIPLLISPHVMRHSKAMHMLQSGVNLIYIRDFLGHVHVKTTEVYARADTEMKRTAIENAHIRMELNLPDWENDKTLMTMLTELCR